MMIFAITPIAITVNTKRLSVHLFIPEDLYIFKHINLLTFIAIMFDQITHILKLTAHLLGPVIYPYGIKGQDEPGKYLAVNPLVKYVVRIGVALFHIIR